MSLRKSWSESVDLALVHLHGHLLLDRLCAVHDLDVQLLEGGVEVDELAGVEFEVVEGERDLVGGQRAVLAAVVEERLGLVRLQNVDRHAGCRRLTPLCRCLPSPH